MPLEKYKSFEDAERALWCFNPDKDYFNRIEKLFILAKALHKTKYPQGVHKYKTFEEAQQALDKWRIEGKNFENIK